MIYFCRMTSGVIDENRFSMRFFKARNSFMVRPADLI